jgi:hypothetical protein
MNNESVDFRNLKTDAEELNEHLKCISIHLGNIYAMLRIQVEKYLRQNQPMDYGPDSWYATVQRLLAERYPIAWDSVPPSDYGERTSST